MSHSYSQRQRQLNALTVKPDWFYPTYNYIINLLF